jgi:hypothetical protein
MAVANAMAIVATTTDALVQRPAGAVAARAPAGHLLLAGPLTGYREPGHDRSAAPSKRRDENGQHCRVGPG